MDTDLAATRQTSPTPITQTLLGGCVTVNFAFVSSFLFAVLPTCKWLSPDHIEGNRSIDAPKDLALAAALHMSLGPTL